MSNISMSSNFPAKVASILQTIAEGNLEARLDVEAVPARDRSVAQALNSVLQRLEKTTINKETYVGSLREALQLQEDMLACLSTLRRLGNLLTNNVGSDEVCREVVRIIVDELDIENCSMMRVTENGDQLRLAAAYGVADHLYGPSRTEVLQYRSAHKHWQRSRGPGCQNATAAVGFKRRKGRSLLQLGNASIY
jgi:hypothetical protein